jgi:3'-phosphoadenosine 5'-phosphosulfate sulfotransferase (PAPS reductase)/FAD synthetase
LKRVVQFSGGLCSFFAASRVIEEFGPEDVTLLFADTLIESQGLYRFALHAVASLGVPFALTCDGRTPFEVFKDERFLGNTRVDLCSRILKRERCRKWMEDNCDPADTVLYVGISWDEDRIDEIRERWKPWTVEAPMCDAPYWSKCDMIREAETLKLPLSEAYRDGFPHDNCGGGCIKAGQAQFALLHQIRPAVYADWEREEEGVRAHLAKDVAILRDRRGGETKPMTLAKFRERIETGDYDKHEWGGCGCGV